jgi:hypothetical protein
MLDGYEEIYRMARKLNLSVHPAWWDLYGCPRWEEPQKKYLKFIKAIRCQACGQVFMVRLVDDVYRHYGRSLITSIIFSGKLPKNWHYGDPPSHPSKREDWGKLWWSGGWDMICMGTTMNSIPEPEFDQWEFSEDGKLPRYKEEHLAEKEGEDED